MRGTKGGGGRHLPSQVRGRSMRDDKREKQTSSRIIKYAISATECVNEFISIITAHNHCLQSKRCLIWPLVNLYTSQPQTRIQPSFHYSCGPYKQLNWLLEWVIYRNYMHFSLIFFNAEIIRRNFTPIIN